MNDIKRVDNETCSFLHKPCIENECPSWRTTITMSNNEFESYMAADIPVSKQIAGTRWCDRHQKYIPICYGFVSGTNG